MSSQTFSYTAEKTTASRMAKALLMLQLKRPASWLSYAVILLALPVSLMTSDHSLIFFAAAMIAFLVLLNTVLYSRTKKTLLGVAGPGQHITTSFTEDSIKITTALATSQIKLSVYAAPEEQSGFVLLRQQPSRVYTILPKELFPDEILARMKREK